MIKNPEYIITAASIGTLALAVLSVTLTRRSSRLAMLTQGLRARNANDASAAMSDITTTLKQIDPPDNAIDTLNEVPSDFAFNGYTNSDPFGALTRTMNDGKEAVVGPFSH